MGDTYEYPVPGHSRTTLGRTLVKHHAVLPHETLGEELASDAAMMSKLNAGIAGNTWGAPFAQHPVVVNNPGRLVIPGALYLDGVAHSKRS